MKETVNRCPFCGGKAFVPGPVIASGYYRISCNRDRCDAWGPYRATLKGAIAAWNKATASKPTEDA